MARILCLLFLLLVGGCRPDIVLEDDQDDAALQGPTWRLTRVLLSDDLIEPPSDEIYSIRFDTASAVVGQSDCNSCEGTYHIRSDGALILSVACTEAGCGSPGSALPHFPVYASGAFDVDLAGSRLSLQKHQNVDSLRLEFEVQ